MAAQGPGTLKEKWVAARQVVIQVTLHVVNLPGNPVYVPLVAR